MQMSVCNADWLINKALPSQIEFFKTDCPSLSENVKIVRSLKKIVILLLRSLLSVSQSFSATFKKISSLISL